MAAHLQKLFRLHTAPLASQISSHVQPPGHFARRGLSLHSSTAPSDVQDRCDLAVVKHYDKSSPLLTS